jgi:hypothetical protein
VYETLKDLLSFSKDKYLSDRAKNLLALKQVLDGTIYDGLNYQFHEEDEGGVYIPLCQRKPNIRANLCKTVVDDSVSLVFGDGHFPEVKCNNDEVEQNLKLLLTEKCFNELMITAATVGSIGSVAILMKVFDDRPFFSVLSTEYLTPDYDPRNPEKLVKVTERYKVDAESLIAQGFEGVDELTAAWWWWQREWDAQSETVYKPIPLNEAEPDIQPTEIDEARTVTHSLGFVPIVWIKNLPGSPNDDSDGLCTFEPAIDIAIQIDYQLSQVGRGLKYSSDPTMLIKDPSGELKEGSGSEDTMDGAPSQPKPNAIVVGEKGDAKMLEINGSSSKAVIEFVDKIREYALESMHGNRADPHKLSAAQSGKAMELMNQALIWLADRLRITYGKGFLQLLKMIIAVNKKAPLIIDDETTLAINALSSTDKLSLQWPAWYPASVAELNSKANTVKTLMNARIITQETAISNVADDFGVTDVKAEAAQANAEAEAFIQATQTQVQERVQD